MVWFFSYTELLRGPRMRQEQRWGWQMKNELRATNEREEGRKPLLLPRPHKRSVRSRTGAASLHSTDPETRGQDAAKNTLYMDMNPEGISCLSLLPAWCVGPVPIWGPFFMGGALSPQFSFWVLFFHVFSCTIIIIISTSWRGVGGNKR